MRLIPSFIAAAAAAAVLAACGTKTPLSLPPQAQSAAKPAPQPVVDDSNKAAAESRQ